MIEFQDYTQQNAPEQARAVLDEVEKAYGMLPNLHKKMAAAPAMLSGYWALSQLFSTCSLSPVEQQVVLIAASVSNNCEYCVSAHSVIANMTNVPPEVIDALRNNTGIHDSKLQALRKLTQAVVVERGWVGEAEIQAFLDAGYNKAQLLEVILGVGMKTLSNYTNHLVETPLDTAFASGEWKKAD